MSILPGTIIVHGRIIVIVRKSDGSLQPFYKRTGEGNRKKGDCGGPNAGEWAPFDGTSQWGWFLKYKYVKGERTDPLYRYGTEENKKIALWLGKQEVPRPEAWDVFKVNDFLRSHGYDVRDDRTEDEMNG